LRFPLFRPCRGGRLQGGGLAAAGRFGSEMGDETGPNGGADIGSVLTSRGLLSGAPLERVRRLEAESGERIDLIAAKLGLVSDRDLAEAYALLLGSPVLTREDFPAEPIAPDRLRPAFLKRARLIPLAETDSAIVIGMADPLDDSSAGAVAFAVRKAVERRAAVPTDIDAVS